MRRLVVTALAAALVLSGCTRGSEDDPTPSQKANGCSDYRPGTSTHTMTVDGQKRRYVVVAPAGVRSGEPRPVVYLFHGQGSNAEQTMAYTGMGDLVAKRGVVLVAPDALGKPSTWDVRGVQAGKGRDAAFLDRVRAEVDGSGCVDTDREYTAGLSNGSAISFALACRKDADFAGYSGVAATFYEPVCDTAPAASIIYFHGTSDPVVPFKGGKTPIFPVRAASSVMDDWAEHDGCSADPQESKAASDVTRYSWTGCDDDERVEYYVIRRGGHTWPGAAIQLPTLGRTTAGVDATTLIADFFDL